MSFDFDTACRCFDDDPAGKDGDRFARYWLSLWQGDRLPMRANFKPKAIAGLLPSICIFEVVPGKSVFCRLAGSHIVEGAGRDITGLDWLALTPPEDRAERLSRFSAVADGAIGRGMRTARRLSGEYQLAEEIMLPFGDAGGGGARQILTFIGWRPSVYDPAVTGITNTGGLLREFRLTQLKRDTATAA